MVVSTLLHEALTIALGAKRFGLLPPLDAPVARSFRLHILGATEVRLSSLFSLFPPTHPPTHPLL